MRLEQSKRDYRATTAMSHRKRANDDKQPYNDDSSSEEDDEQHHNHNKNKKKLRLTTMSPPQSMMMLHTQQPTQKATSDDDDDNDNNNDIVEILSDDSDHCDAEERAAKKKKKNEITPTHSSSQFMYDHDEDDEDDEDDDIVCLSQNDTQTSQSNSSQVSQNTVRTISLKRTTKMLRLSPPPVVSSSQFLAEHHEKANVDEKLSELSFSSAAASSSSVVATASSATKQQQQSNTRLGSSQQKEATTSQREERLDKNTKRSSQTEPSQQEEQPKKKTSSRRESKEDHVDMSRYLAPYNTNNSPATDCSICASALDKSGTHQVCCLPCGHLFGKKCIERWLNRNKTCPLCQKTCFLSDVRLLYIDNICVVDDGRIIQFQSKIKRLRELLSEKNEEIARLKQELQTRSDSIATMSSPFHHTSTTGRSSLSPGTSRLSNGSSVNSPQLNHEAVLLKNRGVVGSSTAINNYDHQSNSSSPPPRVSSGTFTPISRMKDTSPILNARNMNNKTPGNDSNMFQLIKTIPLNEGRVIDFNPVNPLVVTSFKDKEGYKIKQIKLSDISFHSEFLLHKEAIRDIQYCPSRDDLLLSVSVDKTAKVTDLRSNNTSITYNLPHPVWSCCWKNEFSSSTVFFVGCQQSNELYCFDTRKPKECISKYQYAEPNRNTSLTSLQYIPSASGNQVSGVLAGSMGGLHFFSATNGFDSYDLSLEPNCVSVCYDRSSRYCLATFRKNQSSWNYNGDHFVFSLRGLQFDVTPKQHIYNFRNTTISKSILFQSSFNAEQSNSGDKVGQPRTLLCSADESRQGYPTVNIWDVDTGVKHQEIALTSNANSREVVYSCKKHGIYLGVQTNCSFSLFKERGAS